MGMLIGPSPLLWLQQGTSSMMQMCVALFAFGVGEAMSMTPVMDDMMHSCGEYAEESVNALSSLMPAAFSLGQMLGPTDRLGAHAARRLRMGVHPNGLLLAAACRLHRRPRRGAATPTHEGTGGVHGAHASLCAAGRECGRLAPPGQPQKACGRAVDRSGTFDFHPTAAPCSASCGGVLICV